MTTALPDACRKWPAQFAAIVLTGWLGAGCTTIPTTMPTSVADLGPAYKPTNVYKRENTLPTDLRRVALLPMTTTSPTAFLEAGRDAMEPVLYAELEKTKRFEVIPVTRAQMKQWTGESAWRIDEQFPPDMFQRVREGTGCDAVFFGQLTRYQPYQPIAVGWKFTLVEARASSSTNAPSAEVKGLTFWSVDEVLDSGDPGVANAARAYYSQHLRNEAPAADVSTMMSSPTRFGQYAIATLLTSLPDRTGHKK